MCHFCHVLGNNPSAAAHVGANCQHPGNSYFRRPASAPPGPLCAVCSARPRHAGHQFCGRTCAAAGARLVAPPPLPAVCTRCAKRPRHPKPGGGFHPYCGHFCAQAANSGVPRPLPSPPGGRPRPQSARPGKILDGYHGTDATAAALILAHGFRASAATGNMLGQGVYWSDDLA